MDRIQIIVTVVIAGLVVVYVLLRRRGNQPSIPNLPAVSEDVNLPAQNPSTINELDNNRPQQ